jgi:hypothetical protein
MLVVQDKSKSSRQMIHVKYYTKRLIDIKHFHPGLRLILTPTLLKARVLTFRASCNQCPLGAIYQNAIRFIESIMLILDECCQILP